MKPITIKYRGKNQKICSIKADYCHGLYSNNTSYWIFSLNGKQVLNIGKNRLLGGENGKESKKVKKLFGRPWLEKLLDAKSISLIPYFLMF